MTSARNGRSVMAFAKRSARIAVAGRHRAMPELSKEGPMADRKDSQRLPVGTRHGLGRNRVG
ncbi:MAG: hypothetical protein ACJ8D1_04730, partial [Microvirga sp.]